MIELPPKVTTLSIASLAFLPLTMGCASFRRPAPSRRILGPAASTPRASLDPFHGVEVGQDGSGAVAQSLRRAAPIAVYFGGAAGSTAALLASTHAPPFLTIVLT
jgi:hypothetical protein